MKRIILKILRYGFFVLVCLVTVAALIVAEENFRGKREWEKFKREAEGRGEIMSMKPLIPAAVPDQQNFGMTPLFAKLFESVEKKEPAGEAPYQEELRRRLDLTRGRSAKWPGLGDWTTGKHLDLAEWTAYLGDVTQALAKYSPEMDEITEASRRPYARFPVRWEDGFSAMLPHLKVLRDMAALFVLRAHVELANGETDRAITDFGTIMRLVESLKEEPILLSQLVRAAILQHGIQIAWEGLAEHKWSESQLVLLQSQFEKVDILSGAYRAFQGERGGCNDTFEKMISDRRIARAMFQEADSNIAMSSVAPASVFYQNMLSINRFHEEYTFPALNMEDRRVFPRKLRESDERIEAIAKGGSILKVHPYKVFLLALMPALTQCTVRLSAAQTAVDETVFACALERYQLANGAYPDKPDDLVPRFLNKLPHDLFTGEPLKYRRTDDGRFMLYSTGWNETDDQGKVSRTKSGRGREPKQGDWVWAYMEGAAPSAPHSN